MSKQLDTYSRLPIEYGSSSQSSFLKKTFFKNVSIFLYLFFVCPCNKFLKAYSDSKAMCLAQWGGERGFAGSVPISVIEMLLS